MIQLRGMRVTRSPLSAIYMLFTGLRPKAGQITHYG